MRFTTVGIVQLFGVIVAVLVQPTVGSISDYTVSRFGRRKPYVAHRDAARRRLPGRSRDVEHAAHGGGLRPAPAVLVELRAGPVPGLRARPRAAAAGRPGQRHGRPVPGPRRRDGDGAGGGRDPDGRLHLADDHARRHRARDDAVARSSGSRRDAGRRTRGGRSWRSIATEAWGTDILAERSFVFLVASRFFILGGSAFLIVLSVPYLERSLAMTDPDVRGNWLLA